jgi:hypothetical protein
MTSKSNDWTAVLHPAIHAVPDYDILDSNRARLYAATGNRAGQRSAVKISGANAPKRCRAKGASAPGEL